MNSKFAFGPEKRSRRDRSREENFCKGPARRAEKRLSRKKKASLFVILKATEVSKAYERKDHVSTYPCTYPPFSGKCKSDRVLRSYIP